jgi:hypothetical chaperone protein
LQRKVTRNPARQRLFLYSVSNHDAQSASTSERLIPPSASSAPATRHFYPSKAPASPLPSVIFFNAEEDVVSYGRAALNDYLAGYEGRLMRSLKSLLGTPLIDGQTEVLGRSLPFRALLAQFFGELKRRAEHAADRDVSNAVLGRPVFFVDDDAIADQQAEASGSVPVTGWH